MEKKNIVKKKVIVFTPFYNPEPFPINTFVDDLQKSEEVEVVKVIHLYQTIENIGFMIIFLLLVHIMKKIIKLILLDCL